MYDDVFPHHGTIIHNGCSFDRTGIGATARSGSNGAAWVMMKPRTFLSLATKLETPRPSLAWIRKQLQDGVAINPPELTFRLPEGFLPAVTTHEGRHRMTAILELSGNVEVPIRVIISGTEMDEIDLQMIDRIRPRARAQRSGNVVEGPLFGDAVIDLGGFRVSGIPPPLPRRMQGLGCF